MPEGENLEEQEPIHPLLLLKGTVTSFDQLLEELAAIIPPGTFSGSVPPAR